MAELVWGHSVLVQVPVPGSITKANKDHRCQLCQMPILKGDLYVSILERHPNGYVMTRRICKEHVVA